MGNMGGASVVCRSQAMLIDRSATIHLECPAGSVIESYGAHIGLTDVNLDPNFLNICN